MNLEQAEKKYERLAGSNPKNGQTQFALGLIHDAKGDFIQAATAYGKAVELSPKFAAGWFFDGMLAARFSGKTELAVRQWEKALELDPGICARLSSLIPADIDYPLKDKLSGTLAAIEHEALQSPKNSYLAASLALAKGLCLGMDQGLSAFESIKDEIASNIRALYLQALFYFVIDRVDQAVKLLERIVDRETNFPSAMFLLSRAYLKGDKVPQALRILERSLNVDPRSQKAMQLIAEIHFRQGKFESAIDLLKRALEVDRFNAEAHALLGRCYQQLFQLDQAVASYRDAIHSDSSLESPHYHLGVAYSQLGKWPEAVKSFEEALRINPRDSYTHYQLGLAHSQTGNYKDAITAFTEAIHTNPQDAYAHYNLGLAHEKMNRLDDAVTAYREAIKINPNESYARYHLALCYQRLGHYSMALTELEDVLKHNPQDAYAAFNLGSVYAYLGMPDRAREAYARASELNPNDLYAHFNIGAILAREGKVSDANEAFKKAMELTPQNDAELALYSTLLSQMAVNIEIAKLNEKLKVSYFETVKAIIGCLDAKDRYTAGHTNRVSVIATEIGKSMGLSRDEMDSLGVAAVLHDIGKLGVPDAILLKQGKLTNEEFQVMKEHPVKGAKILENVSFPWKHVIQYVKHHHERFDGSGYPDGLKGEEIPIGARILSLSDFFDALATERPYKKAYPIPVVIEEAEKQSGKSFDPNVVDALKRVARNLESLYKPAEELTELPTWESSLVDSA